MIDQQNTPGARARRPRQQTGPEAITPEVSAQYLPPMSVEAEQAVIGAMLISPLAIEKAAELLKPEDFYRENHKLLFESIVAISARSEPVDLVTIQEELQNRGALEQAGGIGYITSLLGMLTPVSHVEHHAKIVDEKAILRRLIDAAMQIIGLARNPEPDQDVASVLDQAEKLIFGVSQRKSNQSFSPLSPLLVSVYDRAEELNEMKTKVSGVATGITEFDYITAGLQKTDLVILAARPSMGKTSFALSIAQHVAIHERKTCALFSLEMSKEQLALRMLCSEAQVNAHRVRTGYLKEEEWTRLANTVNNMFDAPIYIDDATDTSAMTMRAKCRRLAAEHTLGLIIVDYLQLMSSHRKVDNRVQEIGEIARGLKSLARDLNVPVIALSQLSRAVEHRDNKRPMLSDLRESGSIEAEADLVCFLYREQYYKMKEAREAGEGFDAPSGEQIEETEIIIGKHRNGPTGMVKVGFMSDYAKFVNLEMQLEDGSTAF